EFTRERKRIRERARFLLCCGGHGRPPLCPSDEDVAPKARRAKGSPSAIPPYHHLTLICGQRTPSGRSAQRILPDIAVLLALEPPAQRAGTHPPPHLDPDRDDRFVAIAVA